MAAPTLCIPNIITVYSNLRSDHRIPVVPHPINVLYYNKIFDLKSRIQDSRIGALVA